MTHASYKYSVTISSDDLALVNCLRALAQFNQKTGNARIPWGGTKESDWRNAGEKVTFRFNRPQYRTEFIADAKRLLPTEKWVEIVQSDNDPATRQS